MRYPLLIILILTTATVIFGVNLVDVCSWEYVDFLWESDNQKEEAINSGKYDPKKCVLYDVDTTPDGRMFVTSVRDEGVPASLMTVSNVLGPGGPLLDPYPNWSWYKENDCNGIISVYRVSIKCNYLFVLDCGKIGENAVCPPKLLIFNLETDMLVKRVIIPPNIASNANDTGLLVTPLVYVRNCRDINDATVFMADIEGYGLAIYNEKSDPPFCRIESNFMKPTNPDFTIRNQSFHLEDGILGLTIIHKKLFYSPLGGNDIYKMDMCNKDYSECSKITESEADKLTQLAGTLSGQTAPIASEQCAIFFSNIPETSILCQDATKEFTSTDTELIAQDSEKLQFASGMKVTNQGKNKKQLICLTNSFQKVMTNTLNINETNFRVVTMDIEEIRKETNCFASCNDDHNKPEHHGHGHGGHEHGGGHWHGKLWYGKPWYGKPWYDKPWYGKPWYDKHDKYDKYDKHDKYNKYDKHNKYDKDNKHDKNDKDDKHDKYDKYGKKKF